MKEPEKDCVEEAFQRMGFISYQQLIKTKSDGHEWPQ